VITVDLCSEDGVCVVDVVVVPTDADPAVFSFLLSLIADLQSRLINAVFLPVAPILLTPGGSVTVSPLPPRLPMPLDRASADAFLPARATERSVLVPAEEEESRRRSRPGVPQLSEPSPSSFSKNMSVAGLTE
jgi:hypothetical protein